MIGEVRSLGEYMKLATKDGLLSPKGSYAVVINICSSANPRVRIGCKIAYPNATGLFFTSREIAQDYIDVCSRFEPDMKRSGGFIVKTA